MNIKVNNCKNDNTIFNNKNWVEYTDEIKKALEKQIPKQINIKINEFKAEDGYCPNCNERIEVAVWASEYCYECGQKLDWD